MPTQKQYLIKAFTRRADRPVETRYTRSLQAAKDEARKMAKDAPGNWETGSGIVHIEIERQTCTHNGDVTADDVLYYSYCTAKHDGMPRDGWYWTSWD